MSFAAKEKCQMSARLHQPVELGSPQVVPASSNSTQDTAPQGRCEESPRQRRRSGIFIYSKLLPFLIDPFLSNGTEWP